MIKKKICRMLMALVILSLFSHFAVVAQSTNFGNVTPDGRIVTGGEVYVPGRGIVFPPLNPADPKGRELPPGVPRAVDTNGYVIDIPLMFTTKAYAQAAVKLMVQDANGVAEELNLPENRPITISNLAEAYVGAFGINYRKKRIGNVGTTNYIYGFAEDNKFSHIVATQYDPICLSLKKYRLPLSEMDTNAAYELATQWMEAAGMDVTGLNRDCTPHIALAPYWNGHAPSWLGQIPKGGDFVPIYEVWWTGGKNVNFDFGHPAYVELFLPTKQLLQMDVEDPQYILRKPLVFTNLASLFPGAAQISTYQGPAIPVSAPGPN